MPPKNDLRRLGDEDLTEEISSATEELLDLRMKLATRQQKDVRAIPRARRRIARALTARREREIEKSA